MICEEISDTSKKPKRAKIEKKITKGRRGRPPGSKNKEYVKRTSEKRKSEIVVEERDPLLLEPIKILPAVDPPEDCKSAFFEYPDGDDDRNE